MKSFKRKALEKRERLKQERLLREEQARQDRLNKEWQEARDKEKRDAKEWHAIVANKEEQRLLEIKKLNQPKKDPVQKITLNTKIKEDELNSRKDQKNVIQEILSDKSDEKEYVKNQYISSDIELYEARELEKQAEQEKLFLKQEEERLQQEAVDLAEQKLLEEKLKRYKQSEQEEREEKERMRLLREQQAKEKREKTAIRIQEALSSRKIYELRQKKIAKQEKDQRDAINEILQEANEILKSKDFSSRKAQLQKIHDYVYRLDTGDKNKWTNRKQPKSVLTWNEWKSNEKNAILVEEDFQRARLLFEQDNRRAQLYHRAIWQNLIPGRTLTKDRRKKIVEENKLVDISYGKTVSFLEEIVADMDGLQVWLDAASGPEYFDSIVTESVINNDETASIFATWVPTIRTDNNNRTAVTLDQMIDQPDAGANNLVVENPEHLWDGSKDTYMSIKHTSASYDWTSRYTYGNGNAFNNGIVDIRIVLPKDVNDEYHKLERIEVFSTDRKFIPTYMSLWYNNSGGDGFPESFGRNYLASTITSSIYGSYNSILRSDNGKSEASGVGGNHGITPEGSASLDPYIFMPAGIAPVRYNNGKFDEAILSIHRAATGSEIRINQIKFHYHENISGSVTTNGQTVKIWKSKPGKAVTTASANWERCQQASVVYSRGFPYDHPGTNSLRWFTGSSNDPSTVLDGKLNMPYVNFSSESIEVLECAGEFLEVGPDGGMTQFIVQRSQSGNHNITKTLFADGGASGKTYYQIYNANFIHDTAIIAYDFEEEGTGVTTRHNVTVGSSVADGETDQFGTPVDDVLSLKWPYIGQEWKADQPNFSSEARTRRVVNNALTTCQTFQLDNTRAAAVTGSSRARVWINGGTPFVDMDNSVNVSYNFTGSHTNPTIGGNGAGIYPWAGRMHEMLIFNRILSTDEIDQVHDYLNAKWRLGFIKPAESDLNNQFVYGVSSSNSSQDIWRYDGTDAAFPGDPSAWELG